MTNILSKTRRFNLGFVQINKFFHSKSRNEAKHFIMLNSSLLFNRNSFKNVLQQKCRFLNTSKPNFSNKNQLKVFYFIYNTLQYAFIFTVTAGIGLITGYNIYSPSSDEAQSATTEYQATKLVENNKKEFPLKLHLYQYESCPNCSQIRAYLKYFGFSYKLTEVDSYSKNDALSFTLNRNLPILVFQHRDNKQSRWHLSNATAIISALESVRNEIDSAISLGLSVDVNDLNYSEILNKYLPVLKGNELQAEINPFKYHVSNSELNSVEWRRWIDDNAVPVFKLNSISSLDDLNETFDMYSKKSDWELRFSNKLKLYYVYYASMFRAYFSESDKLKKELKSKFKTEISPREMLDITINKWEDGLTDKFINGNEPSLADISMYGNISSYEGCKFLQEALEKHVKFSDWYTRMKEKLESGYIEITKKIEEKIPDEEVNEIELEIPIDNSISSERSTQSATLRILSVIYIAHVLAFTYAAHMSR